MHCTYAFAKLRTMKNRNDEAGFAIHALLLISVIVLFGFVVLSRSAQQKTSAPSKTSIDAPVSDSEKTLYYDGNSTGTYEIYALSADTKNSAQLTNNEQYDSWWPRISPDKSKLLFYRTPAGTHDRDYTKTELWQLDIDNNVESMLIANGANNWEMHGHAEWSASGNSIVMFGGSKINPQIYITDSLGNNPEKLTSEGGQNLDPSWHPNGKQIVYVGCPKSICFPQNQEIYEITIGTKKRTRLTMDDVRDHDPYYSPDGTQIAFLSQTSAPTDEKIVGEWDIRIYDGKVKQLTNFRNVVSLPTWADNETILTHGFIYGSKNKFDLYEVSVPSGQVTEYLSEAEDQEYVDL